METSPSLPFDELFAADEHAARAAARVVDAALVGREGCNGSGGRDSSKETFLRAQSVALTRQGHALGRTYLLDPADAERER